MLKVAAREVFDVGVFCDLFGSIVVWGWFSIGSMHVHVHLKVLY